MKQMKIYLASPFFNEEERGVYQAVITTLRKKGYDLFVPAEHEISNAWELSNQAWGEAVFGVDVLAINKCDVVIALNWGMYSDSGTAWELGYAFALGKKTINVYVLNNNTYSLMMTNGANYNISLTDFLINDIEDILADDVNLCPINIEIK